MTTPPKQKTGAGSTAVFVLLAALALPGCDPASPAQKTPEQIRAEAQADIAATNAKLLTDLIAIKCRPGR